MISRNVKIGALLVAAVMFLGFRYIPNLTGQDQNAKAAVTMQQVDTQVKDSSSKPLNSLKDLNDAVVDIAKKTNPTVVTIFTSQTVNVRQMNPFAPFFGGQPEQNQQYQREGLGSGVIVSSDGYILTNNHVVEDADTISVRLYNDEEVGAKVVGTDPRTDIAVIKVDAKDLPVAQLGNSDDLNVGEFVLAIGSPLSPDLAHTVTFGIVSARGRVVQGLSYYQDFIQTDAAINPGNSGGALINLDGKLIGINSAIASRSGGNQGIGFAIPINLAKNVMDSIIKHGHVIRGYLGIRMGPVDETMAKALGLDRPQGVLVNSVEKGQPADKAGLKEGDVIVKINGDQIENPVQFATRVASTTPGEQISLEVIRDGKHITVKPKLTEMPSSNPAASGGRSGNLEERLGFAVNTMNSDLARKYNINSSADGVVVTGINPRSKAYEQGLREGDLIVSIRHMRIENKSDFEKAMNELVDSGSQVVLMRVIRDGNGIFIAFEL